MSAPSIPIVTQYPVATNQTLQFYWSPPVIGAPFDNYTLTLNPGALVYTVSPDATNYTVSGLTNGTTYTATLYATNGNGNGPAVTFETAEPGFLANPPDSAAATAIGSGAVVVSWSPPSILPIAPIRYYVVEVVSSDPTDNANPTRYTALPPQRSLLVPNLNVSNLYSFKVYTVNSVGYSIPQTTTTTSFQDNQGQVQWATGLFANTTANFASFKTAVDGSGNLYILGFAQGGPALTLFDFVSAPATLGGQISTTVSAVYTGTNGLPILSHIVLVKYNSAGILQWAVPVQMTSTAAAINFTLSFTVDGSGNPTFAITYSANARLTFNNFVSINTTTKLTQVQPCGNYNLSSGTTDILLVKYNSTGQFQWMTTIGSASVTETQGDALQVTNALTTDTTGNIYMLLQNSVSSDTNLSYFYNAAAFVGANLTPVLYGGCLGRGFLVKYNAQGQVQWINRITGSSGSTSGRFSIATDATNNILTTEYAFREQSTFIQTVVGVSAGILSTTRVICIPAINTAGQFDSILSKYNSNGQFLYATRTNDTQVGSGGGNYFTAIATDTTNAVYLATQNVGLTSNFLNSYYSTFNGSNISTIQGPRLQNFTAATDLYVIKYNSFFQFQTAAGFYISTGSTINMGQQGGVVCDSYNNVYFSGNFRSTMQVRTLLSTTATNTMIWSTIATTSNYNSTTSFLAKFDSNLNYKWLTIMASYDVSPTTSITATTNQWLAIDNSNNLYTIGNWSVRNPMFMQFANASTLTTDNYIQTQPYGYISSFTSTNLVGTSTFTNSYIAKFA